jgi:hypothetical protein
MPRLGVSWNNDGVGKGVGSELNPAMAALVMASQSSGPPQGDVDDASPRLSGKPLLSLRDSSCRGVGLVASSRRGCFPPVGCPFYQEFRMILFEVWRFENDRQVCDSLEHGKAQRLQQEACNFIIIGKSTRPLILMVVHARSWGSYCL